MDFITGALGVICGFSVLIFVHELGHYALAKWNGVRVYVFSIGMGPYVVSFTWRDTVYVISLIPMGGYVKMAGQDDMNANLPRNADPMDYRNKRPGQRAAILAAGAFFNLIFAFFAFTACYYYGVEMQAPIVGEVAKDSPLAKAKMLTPSGMFGLQPLQKGDRITMVNGVPVKSLMEVKMEIAGAGPEQEVWLNYERNGMPAQNPVKVVTVRSADMGAASVGLNPYGEEERFHVGFATDRFVFVPEPPPVGSPACNAGLTKGDKILRIDGLSVRDGLQIVECVQTAKGAVQKLLIEREGVEKHIEVQAKFDEKAGKFLFGLPMGRASQVTEIAADSEAFKAGLRKGHFIIAAEKLRSGDKLKIAYAPTPNEGDASECLIPIRTESSSELVYEEAFPKIETIKEESLIEALALAWSDVIRNSKMVFVVVRGLLTRAVDYSAVSGPLGIANFLTRVAVESPFMYYFWFLGILSVNLGVLQFLPIPILDGWHLIMIAVEKIKGSPVTPKVQEVFQYVGLFVLLAIMLLATKNDIVRFLP